MDETLATILKDTYSIYQFKSRLRLLKSNLLKNLFGSSQQPNTLFSPADLNWLKSLPANFYQQFNKDNVYDQLATLEKEVAKLPVLIMYLTFEPDDTTLTDIGSFARKNFGALFLDIKLNPKLIAGTSLVWKGRIKDYSLRASLEAKKTEIFQEFKKFLR